MLDTLGALIRALDRWIWGAPMILLLMGSHVFLTVRTGFIQRKTAAAIRLSVARDPEAPGDVSPFGALATALASTIGTGNIVGVGTAIALGGPGAVLWCWLTGVLGMATQYAESLLAVRYRVQSADGRLLGGAMYVLDHRLHRKRAARAFALFTVLAAFGAGCGVQVSAIAAVLRDGWHIAPASVGVLVSTAVALVIFGGVGAIARVCQRLVPLMALAYMGGCAALLAVNRQWVWPALCWMAREAFIPGAAAGGLLGGGILAAARAGVARGLFSNEAGMGSAAIVAAAARCRNPVRQALVASTATFWDTVVMCLVTGGVLVSGLLADPTLAAADGGGLTAGVFAQLPAAGPLILTGGMVLFAFSTILGWSYFGERGAEYLWGTRALKPYRAALCVCALVSALVRMDTAWALADVLNALMALPNLAAVLALHKEVAAETHRWLAHLDERDLRRPPRLDPGETAAAKCTAQAP